MRDLSPGVRAVPIPVIDVYLGASLAGRSAALAALAGSESARAVAKRLDAIRPYWRDGYPDSLEVIALADRLGLLFEHPRSLFSTQPVTLRNALSPLRPGAFPCELPPFLTLLGQRIAVLRESAPKLQSYIQFLAAVWGALEPAQLASQGARVSEELTVADLPRTHVARALPEVRRRLEEAYTPERILIVQALIVPATGFFILLEDRAILGASYLDEGWSETSHVTSMQIARQHAVLADPTRVMILAHLGRRERSVTQIATDLHMTQPNATRHIKILLDARLIVPRREGRLTYYYAPESALREHFERAARDLETLTIW